MELTKEQWLDNWEGNRRLTIRTIEAFPEESLFTYTPTEPLRPFSQMVVEILNIEKGYVRGIALDDWVFNYSYTDLDTKAALLEACEQVRAETIKLFAEITDERLATVEKDPFFDAPPMSHFSRLVYALENEIHHRGQGFVYLRMLGIEPPAFFER